MARSEVNRVYDNDLAFRAPGSAAVTADATIGTLKLDKMVNAREGDQKNKLGAEDYEVVIVVAALATAGADEVYTFNVVVGADGAAATNVGSVTVTQTGQHIVKLDAHTIEKLDADHVDIALALDVTGAAPSITFSAWLL